MILNGLPWKWTEIILSFLRLHPCICISDSFVDYEGYSLKNLLFLDIKFLLYIKLSYHIILKLLQLTLGLCVQGNGMKWIEVYSPSHSSFHQCSTLCMCVCVVGPGSGIFLLLSSHMCNPYRSGNREEKSRAQKSSYAAVAD